MILRRNVDPNDRMSQITLEQENLFISAYFTIDGAFDELSEDKDLLRLYKLWKQQNEEGLDKLWAINARGRKAEDEEFWPDFWDMEDK